MVLTTSYKDQMNMKKLLKRGLSILLTVLLAIGIVPITPPVSVQASATSAKQFYNPDGTPMSTNYQKVQFGNTLWRILDAGDNELFLLRDEVETDRRQFHANDTLSGPSSYEKSNIRSYLRLNVTGSLRASERNAVSLQNVIANNGYGGVGVTTPDENGDGVFLLSVTEANNTKYFPKDSVDRRTSERIWWLRTAGNSTGYVGFINGQGAIGYQSASGNDTYVRPAVKLKMSRVLFASNQNGTSTGGKTRPTGSTFASLSSRLHSTIRLTVLDDNQNFSATMVQREVPRGGQLLLDSYSYSNVPNSNSYLSAIFDDGNGNIYYNTLQRARGAAEGTNLSIDVTGVPAGNYTLKLFTEQTSSAASDTASAMVEFNNVSVVNVLATPIPTVTPSPVPTATPSPVPTATPSPVPTATPSPVPTATPSPVPTAMPSPVPTNIPVPTPTNKPVPTPTNKSTPTPTNKPTPTPTAIPTVDRPFSAVQGLSAITPSKKAATLSWKKAVGATSHEILRSNKKASGFKVIKTLGQNATSFKDTSIAEGKTYYYKVRAKNGKENKDSKVITVKTIAKPKSLKLKNPGSKLKVSYKGTEKNYQIQVSKKKKSGYKTLTNKCTKKSYTATNKKIRTALKLRKGKSYNLYVRVRSYRIVNNKKVYSSWATPKMIKNFNIK